MATYTPASTQDVAAASSTLAVPVTGVQGEEVRAVDATSRDLLLQILEAIQLLAEQDTLLKRGITVRGTLDGISGTLNMALPAGASISTRQVAGGTAGAPSSEVQTVQGIVGGQPVDTRNREGENFYQQMIDLLTLMLPTGQPTNLAPATANSMAALIVSTSAIRLAGANASRKSLLIMNNSTGSLYIGNTSKVTTSGATMGAIVGSGGYYSDSGAGVDVGEVWGIYSALASSANIVVSDRS